MRLAVIGSSYVGLVTAACLADFGNDVVCASIQPGRGERLARGEVDLYEPGLLDLIERNARAGRVRFDDDLDGAVRFAEVILVAITITREEDGRPNLAPLFEVGDRIGKALDGYKVIATRNTVPVGSTDRLETRIGAHTSERFAVVCNPAFIKVGNAIGDFTEPHRVVIGTRDARAAEVMKRLYAPCVRDQDRFYVTDTRTAELSKYASSAILAARVSFMNDLAALADELGADIETVRTIMGADPRIGPKYLFVGPGFGGTQLTEDVVMLLEAGQEVGRDLALVRATLEVNRRQKRLLAEKLERQLHGGVEGKTIAVWGLSFKPNTDDVGEGPALTLIDMLLERGARVRVHDPKAMNSARALFGDRVQYLDDMYDAAAGADALVVVTEWAEYRTPDFQRLREVMAGMLLLDGRNIWSQAELRELGFRYLGIGYS